MFDNLTFLAPCNFISCFSGASLDANPETRHVISQNLRKLIFHQKPHVGNPITWSTLLSELKRLQLTYSREKKFGKLRGFVIGIRLKEDEDSD